MKKTLLLLLACFVSCLLWADEPFRKHRYDLFKVIPPAEGSIVFVGNRTTDKTLTPFHFFVGDNSRNLAYGVVVADNAYNPDSIAPVYDYILDDILHLLNNWTTYKTR